MKPVRRKFSIPEVLQASLMDCGPAALSAVCEGYGISVSYDELRDRCATDVDGTSIDALAALAVEVGLATHQILISLESFLLPEAQALPAIVVTRAGGGVLHFIVVWRRIGAWVQILDPGSGRRWLHWKKLLAQMPSIPSRVSRQRFRRWAESENAQAPLRARLQALGFARERPRALVERALEDASWRGFGTLDAAVRMLEALVASGAVRRGRAARRLLEAAVADGGALAEGSGAAIPERFFWVREQAGGAELQVQGTELQVQGTVVVHFSGATASGRGRQGAAPARTRLSRAETQAAEGCEAEAPGVPLAASSVALAGWPAPAISALFAARLEPLRVLARLAWYEAPGRSFWMLACCALAALLVPLEALALRALLGVDMASSLLYQRALGLAAVFALVALGAWLESWSLSALAELGRVLETRLRVAFLHQLPRLEDKYLRTRPTSDMAARGAALHLLREVPVLWSRAFSGMFTVLSICGTLAWLYPEGLRVTLGVTLAALCVPYLARKGLTEASLRLRTHAAALDRFYLDALIGVSPVRVHGAESAVASEHEQLLTEWAHTAHALDRQTLRVQALQLALGTLLTGALVFACVAAQGGTPRLLLLAFLGGRLSSEAARAASAEVGLRRSRGAALRLLSPLAATRAESLGARALGTPAAPVPALARGVSLSWQGVTVCVGGHDVLENVSLDVPAGSHVAVVGASGAGKSSLLGSLLGWWQPTSGRLLVDGAELDSERLAALRAELAWIDPGLQLFAGSLHENLTYAEDRVPPERLPRVLETADLLEVLETLPQGMQTDLGESGVRVSGGQGQRVRLGRALLQSEARLVILDEAFRGMEHQRRRELLARVRSWYAHATLIFVSHDIEDASGFERVVVLDRGKIVEDGPPGVLQANAGGRFAALLSEQRRLAQELWRGALWQHKRLANGSLVEGS